MAAGLTDHVWTLRDVLLFPIPPWPQPQAVEATGEDDHRTTERARCARRQAKGAESGLGTPMGAPMTGWFA
jgi:hypothetical protein